MTPNLPPSSSLVRQVVGPGPRVAAALERLHAERLLVAMSPPRQVNDGTVTVTVWLRQPAAIASSTPGQAGPTRTARRRWRLVAAGAVVGVAVAAAAVAALVWLVGAVIARLPLILGAGVLAAAVLVVVSWSGGGRHCPGCRG